MKTRIVIGSLMATVMAFQVLAQRVENDDMYFNAKDREKLMSEKPTASVNDKIDGDYNTFRKKHFDKNEEETVNESANPTDSYSARTINPEYISRSNSEQASEDEQNYYVEGYAPANTYDSYSASDYNNNSNWNYNNSYYGNNYGYGNSLYSPYYGSCNPWMSPYYSGGSGWMFSLGYMWGSPGWNYGMNYGWGNSYYNPYSYYPAYYSPYYSGYPTYYYGGSESSRPNQGKRPSRHSAVVSPTPRSSERVTSNTNTSNGRTNGRSRQADDYYVKPFKRTTIIDNSINSSGENSRDRLIKSSTDYPASRTRESHNSSNTSRDSRPAYSAPSRSSSPGVSTPTRSSSSGSSSTPRKRD